MEYNRNWHFINICMISVLFLKYLLKIYFSPSAFRSGYNPISSEYVGKVSFCKPHNTQNSYVASLHLFKFNFPTLSRCAFVLVRCRPKSIYTDINWFHLQMLRHRHEPWSLVWRHWPLWNQVIHILWTDMYCTHAYMVCGQWHKCECICGFSKF